MTSFDPFPPEEGVAAKPSTLAERRVLAPEELIDWLDLHHDAIAERWLVELRSRGEGVDDEVLVLLREFVHLLVAFLAPGMGALRAQVEGLLQQAAELYGNLGAHRGQAAGEAVEEFQLLRELVLRYLYDEPPAGGVAPLGIRDVLRLHRLIDLGVTYASIGHTDTLFFQLFHGKGVTDGLAPAVLEEVREQVRTLREDIEGLNATGAREAVDRAN